MTSKTEITVGTRVRSYDFAHSRDCYVEGVVQAVGELVPHSCARYSIKVDKDVFRGVDYTVGGRVGQTVFPPVNGTPSFQGPTAFVEVV